MVEDLKIVGLIGRLQSGKSVVAQHLIKHYTFKRIKFATPMKNMCKAFGLTPDMIEGDLKETQIYNIGGKTPRYFMQTLGTDWGRKMIWEDLWVYAWKQMVINCPCTLVVADDVRFLNEYQAVHALTKDSMVIKVVRGQEATYQPTEHESEQYVDVMRADAMLYNHGTIPELLDQVDRLMNRRFGMDIRTTET